jgi:hypothetical protein
MGVNVDVEGAVGRMSRFGMKMPADPLPPEPERFFGRKEFCT